MARKPANGVNALYSRYKYECKRRNIFWGLSKDEFWVITSLPCHYCGLIPSQQIKNSKGQGAYLYSGIDRANNDQGYVLANCVPACVECNEAKRARPLQEWLDWINRLVEHHGKRTVPSEQDVQGNAEERAAGPGNEEAKKGR